MDIAFASHAATTLASEASTPAPPIEHQPGETFFERVEQFDRDAATPPPPDHGANLITPEMREHLSRGDGLLDLLGPVQRYLGNAREIQERVDRWVSDGRVAPDDPRIASAQALANGEMLKAQAAAQQYGLTVEVASKIVEQATNGTRTILQTQA